MKLKVCLSLASLVFGIHLAHFAEAQTQEPVADTSFVDGSDLRKEMTARESKILELSTEEQLQLRAAQLKAAEDAEVRTAFQKRNQALEEFRLAFRAGLIKADPKISAILDKIAVGANPGY